MVHRVAAHALRVGRLDDDVAAQVGDLAAVVAVAEVLVLQRLVERELRSPSMAWIDALLGVTGVLRWRLDVAASCGDDDAVAGLPAGDRLGERDRAVARLRGGAELDPGAAQRRAVEVHAAAAADDRRARLLVQARRRSAGGSAAVCARRDGPLRRADLQGGARAASAAGSHVGVAVEAVLAGVVARLDLDQADVQAGVLVAAKLSVPATWIERITASDSRRRRRGVPRESAPLAGAGVAPFPGGRGRPVAAFGGTHQPRQFIGGLSLMLVEPDSRSYRIKCSRRCPSTRRTSA